MKLLIILPAKIQAEMPFQQRCKEQVVKYSPKMFWKVHANWFVAKVFSLKTSRTLVLQTCINGKETGISATTTEEQHYYRLQANSLPDSCSVDSSINMRQSWMKSVENFALSYPQNAYPVDLVPLWRLPSHHPGQCCSDGVRKYTATFFWRERVVFAVASAFRSFIFKLDIATCIFLNVFFFQNLSTEQGLLPERQCGFRDIGGTVDMIFAAGHGSISTNTTTSLPHLLTWPRRSTRLVVMTYAKLCQSLDVPHFHHHC